MRLLKFGWDQDIRPESTFFGILWIEYNNLYYDSFRVTIRNYRYNLSGFMYSVDVLNGGMFEL